MRISKFLIAWGIIALLITSCKQVVRKIDLSGEWEVALDSLDKGIAGKWYMESFPDKIALPGTLCDAGYGTPCTLEPTMDKEIRRGQHRHRQVGRFQPLHRPFQGRNVRWNTALAHRQRRDAPMGKVLLHLSPVAAAQRDAQLLQKGRGQGFF